VIIYIQAGLNSNLLPAAHKMYLFTFLRTNSDISLPSRKWVFL